MAGCFRAETLPLPFAGIGARTTFRGARRWQWASYDHEHGETQVRGDRSLLTYAHGSRAYSRDGGCVVETFFSLFFKISYVFCYVCLSFPRPLWSGISQSSKGRITQFRVQRYSFLFNYARKAKKLVCKNAKMLYRRGFFGVFLLILQRYTCV